MKTLRVLDDNYHALCHDIARYIREGDTKGYYDVHKESDLVFEHVYTAMKREIANRKNKNDIVRDRLEFCMRLFVNRDDYFDIDVMDDVVEYYRLAYIKKSYDVKVSTPLVEQPATEKQIKYLKGLGCSVIPTSKKHAMDLISGYIK